MMVLIGVLLGVFLFLWARALYGHWAASLAIALYAFCPNILAHTRLITPDIVLTAFSFIAMYFFWRLLRNGTIKYAVFCGAALGLALLAKYTAVLLLPACIGLALLQTWQRKRVPVVPCLVAAALAAAVLLLGYQMNLEPYFAGITFSAGACESRIGGLFRRPLLARRMVVSTTSLRSRSRRR